MFAHERKPHGLKKEPLHSGHQGVVAHFYLVVLKFFFEFINFLKFSLNLLT